MGVTDDRDDPALKNIQPSGMQEKYLVLSEDERKRGFVRPLRHKYVHVGIPGPEHELVDLTDEQKERYESKYGYVKFEPNPDGDGGMLWSQEKLDRIDGGCGTVTTMGNAIAETYARQPNFYGGTFCAGCGTHFPVGRYGEFVWDGTTERVGT